MWIVHVENVVLSINVTEDRNDEPRLFLGLVVATPVSSAPPPQDEIGGVRVPGDKDHTLDVTFFDSGILREDVPAGTNFRLPIIGRDQVANSDDFVYSSEIDPVEDGQIFTIVAMGWDDDASRDFRKRKNEATFRDALQHLRFPNVAVDGERRKTWFRSTIEDMVGDDDPIGMDAKIFTLPDLNANLEDDVPVGRQPWSMTLAGFSGDALYTLRGTTVFTNVPDN